MQYLAILSIAALASMSTATPIRNLYSGNTHDAPYDQSSSPSDNLGGSRAVISNWQTCIQGQDTCTTSGYVCCVAQADIASNKATCRPQGECTSGNGGGWNNGGNNGGWNNGGNNGWNQGSKVADWQTCQQGRDSCSNSNYVCCIAPADQWTKKTTCRPQNDCFGGNNGGNNGGWNNGGNKIADWQTCQQGRDTCNNSNYVCCVANADLGSEKGYLSPSKRLW